MVTQTVQPNETEPRGIDELTEDEIEATADTDESRRVTIYETRTGEPRSIPRVNRPWVLQKLHVDENYPDLLGKPVFSEQPVGSFKQGEQLCMLHRDHPASGPYLERGTDPCIANKIPSPYEVDRHMEIKHPRVWNAMKAEREQREREQDRQERREMMAMLMGTKGSPVTPDAEQPVSKPLEAIQCPHCSELGTGSSKSGAKNNLKAHIRRAHPSS